MRLMLSLNLFFNARTGFARTVYGWGAWCTDLHGRSTDAGTFHGTSLRNNNDDAFLSVN